MVLRLLETLLAIAFFYVTFKWLWKQWVLAGIKTKGKSYIPLIEQLSLLKNMRQNFQLTNKLR